MNAAYWISPDGVILVVTGGTHISMVISEPEKFGISRKEIEAVYKRHKESIGQEGRAREEIIKGLYTKGWIRIRNYREHVSVQFGRLDKRTKDLLFNFAKRITRRGIDGIKLHSSTPCHMVGFSDGSNTKMTLSKMARDGLFDERVVSQISLKVMTLEQYPGVGKCQTLIR